MLLSDVDHHLPALLLPRKEALAPTGHSLGEASPLLYAEHIAHLVHMLPYISLDTLKLFRKPQLLVDVAAGTSTHASGMRLRTGATTASNAATGGAEPVESGEEGSNAATGGAFRISAKQVPDEIVWWLKFMEAQHKATSRERRIDYCKYVVQQTDGLNCGIYTIANAVAATLGEDDCGEIDPGAWRKWLTCEIIAQGLREDTHDKDSLLHGGKYWRGWLGAPDSGKAQCSSKRAREEDGE